MAVEFTKELIEQAFDAMGALAAGRGLVIDIAVFGGSCLVLASDIRNSSGDVDSVFLSDPKTVRQIADDVACRMGFPLDWINEAVRRAAPPIGNPEPNLLPFGDYPRAGESPVGLRVFLPTPAYMLAMKLLAARVSDDSAKIQSDLQDAAALMKVTGIATREALLALLQECYPHLPAPPSLNARLAAKIDAMIDAYAKSADAPDPTWNAGTGPPTRSG